jgi:hypothetical protein
MNWKHGLFRLWVVSSVSWATFVGWLAYSERTAAFAHAGCAEARHANPALGSPSDCFVGNSHFFDDLIPLSSFIGRYVPIALGPILATLIIGLAGAWIAAGFRRGSGGQV